MDWRLFWIPGIVGLFCPTSLSPINHANIHWQLLAVQLTLSFLSGEQPDCHFMLMDSLYSPSEPNGSDVENYVRELVQFLWTQSFRAVLVFP